MGHLVKYSFFQSIREKEVVFWSLLFPIILSTLFFFSFMGGGKQAESEPVATAVYIDRQAKGTQQFVQFLKQLDKEVLDISYMSQEKGEKELLAGRVSGMYVVSDQRTLYVSASGMEESILQSLLDSYDQNEAMIAEAAAAHPENLKKMLLELSDHQKLTKEVSLGGKTLSGDIQYFFALIAMACMFGSFGGFPKAIGIKANISALGARRSVTPTRRIQVILADMAVAVAIQLVNMLILLLFLKYVLRVGFDGNTAKMLLICLFGSLIGVSMGILVGSVGKWSEGMKIGSLIGISLLCSFLSGLMVSNMKDVVERYAPLLNRVNPAAVIADAFYCLAVYNDNARYYRDIATLGMMSVVLVFISFLIVRRESYDSI